MSTLNINNAEVTGEFVSIANERYYAIYNVDKMDPFFVSVISSSDHWLFVSSTGGLTAGRVSPETALFPYITVDKIHESDPHTGCKTIVRATLNGEQVHWHAFNRQHAGRFNVSRNIYKSVLGNKLCFEEINHDLGLLYRYTWSTNDEFGFVRHSELQNLNDNDIELELIDGLQNLLPAGTPRFTQANSSNLVDAYKWTELEPATGLAYFTLYSGITDRAEPCESLKANAVFCLGLDNPKHLLSSEQLSAFGVGQDISQENQKRGIRGAYFVNASIKIAAKAKHAWQLVANLELDQAEVVSLCNKLKNPSVLAVEIESSIAQGSDNLAKIMAGADGFQSTGEEMVSEHHYANVLFNVLRGGALDEQYMISSADFSYTLSLFNRDVHQKHKAMLDSLPEQLHFSELKTIVDVTQDPQLARLFGEYLPISFGRRHGDPSRPWNQFAIKLVDENNNRLLTYQGNWRDIFQNWEALMFSYPLFTENVIAKFVNASTMDGYNPYRITKEGIDWEVEEPDDPWSYIGYWGDHQIIYLQKMLELSHQFQPAELHSLLRKPLFSYANVPYRIKPFDALMENAKDTVEYDENLSLVIEQRVAEMGADGKLVLNHMGQVYQVNLFEKLLVPLLSKLSNLVVDGGIWLNTQRPEWNDANNALVGQGLSLVTLCYLRRYVCFFQDLIKDESLDVMMSKEVGLWLVETSIAIEKLATLLGKGKLSAEQRHQSLVDLGMAASHYRQTVYKNEGFSGQSAQSVSQINKLLTNARKVIEHTINTNIRPDGLYNAYNLLNVNGDKVDVETLYPMLEGQVAALSSGALDAEAAINVINTLFESDVYREDQLSFMLYPDRKLPNFLEKNCVNGEKVSNIPTLTAMLSLNDKRIIVKDDNGVCRFNADITNSNALQAVIEQVKEQGFEIPSNDQESIFALYEDTFNHQEFTGRSGGMFGFEGLGCIYWHMVSKLLLAVSESYFTALDNDEYESTLNILASLYYRVRDGIGFNKTALSYGAFPADPYSHTPKHSGAQQPGMTGQVKEEILTRFGELGIRVKNGRVAIQPSLLQSCEFKKEESTFRYLDVKGEWCEISVPGYGLAFTWCQVPFVYQLDESKAAQLTIQYQNGSEKMVTDMMLSEQDSAQIFARSGGIKQITVSLPSSEIFN